MVKLLIVADDFTGALDTAVQFASCGARTKVVTDSRYNFENIDESIEVLVLNAETRHLNAEAAYSVIYQIVRQACTFGISYIYKKTDSALRGNIGSELTAVLDAANALKLHFLPALPRMNRITKKGIHYIDDVPVNQSVFGKDPFEPVTMSSISDMIAQQSQIRVTIVEEGGEVGEMSEPTIVVYDAQTDEEVLEIAKSLHKQNQLCLMAGCAGFAAVLPKLLNMIGKKHQIPQYKSSFLVICGSVNPITKAQLDYAEKEGFYRIRLTTEQKLSDGYMNTDQGRKDIETWKNICSQEKKCIIDSNDLPGENDTLDYAGQHAMSMEEVRLRISTTLGQILKDLIMAGIESTIMLTGGDTLLGFMNQIETTEMTPIYEIAPGVVSSYIQVEGKTYEIISKSGGFGEESLLVNLADIIIEGKEEKAI